MQIFSRWGELLYSEKEPISNDPQEGWDGTYEGKYVEQGVYVYYFLIEYDDGYQEKIVGDLTIAR